MSCDIPGGIVVCAQHRARHAALDGDFQGAGALASFHESSAQHTAIEFLLRSGWIELWPREVANGIADAHMIERAY